MEVSTVKSVFIGDARSLTT